MRTKIIGLNGNIGSGKSTYVARALVEDFGCTGTRFAEYIKRTIALWGFTPEEIDGNLKETPCDRMLNIVPRHAMRVVGTEVGRNIHPDLWVHLWKTLQAEPIIKAGGVVVVDDCRFPNEANCIRAMGGVIIKVVRPSVGVASNHASDTQEIVPDATLMNDGDYELLVARLTGTLELLENANLTSHVTQACNQTGTTTETGVSP